MSAGLNGHDGSYPADTVDAHYQRLANNRNPNRPRSPGQLDKALASGANGGRFKAQGKFEKAKPLVAELLAKQRKLAEEPDASVNDLNTYAWDLLTIEPADLPDPVAALPVAQEAVEGSAEKNAGIVATLALAQQMIDDMAAAVETEKTAVALLPHGRSPLRTELETNLAKYLIE